MTAVAARPASNGYVAPSSSSGLDPATLNDHMAAGAGSLVRLYESECFDAHLHMHYLFTMAESRVQGDLVNEMHRMPEHEIDFYLPQLVHTALLRFKTAECLHRFLLDKAAKSTYFALKIHWLVQATLEDATARAREVQATPELWEHAQTMGNMCETAMVNAPRRPPEDASVASQQSADMANGVSPTAAAAAQRTKDAASNDLRQRSDKVLRHLADLSQALSPEQKAAALRCVPTLPNAYVDLGDPAGSILQGEGDGSGKVDLEKMQQFLLKRRRCDFFNAQTHLLTLLLKLSSALVAIQDRPERQTALRSSLSVLNRWLFDRRIFQSLAEEEQLPFLGLHIPILTSCRTRQILRIHTAECKVFHSATRAPFLLVYESADVTEVGRGAAGEHGEDSEASPDADASGAASSRACEVLAACIVEELGASSAVQKSAAAEGEHTSEGASPRSAATEALLRKLGDISSHMTRWWQKDLPRPPDPAMARPVVPRHCGRCPYTEAWQEIEDFATTPRTSRSSSAGLDPLAGLPPRCVHCPAMKRAEQAAKVRQQIWGESWQVRRDRAKRNSPFGQRYASWSLDAIFVKSCDDLRQELLAAQLIKEFSCIFKEAKLPLWLKEIDVLVTSADSGLVECIHDAVSVDGLKKHYPGKTLADIFKVAFADVLFEAKRNFIESCAAYSLVIWFLQVKDRHNANLMLDSSGHVVHIDFGFMLSNSPGGNMAFEQSPFKLTQEFVDVMDGECSDQYEYFRTLVIRGFLEARKQMERILLPVHMLLEQSRMPCFGPEKAKRTEELLDSMRERFLLDLSEEACIERIVDLIDSSVRNWRTETYDTYQRLINGIL
eukprot:TRINITY_DN18235_c0_g1_i1.p1 TRINITY_DN18235_c0_g1~~TRINITY_DN18235_c0_g1_i1.p1  ORF type:complete len:855 (+),score=200.47 TRINITY_DN18235_c0_g1_i1:52-2565(+)